jgi:acyl-CoA synthetase (NDP forming)
VTRPLVGDACRDAQSHTRGRGSARRRWVVDAMFKQVGMLRFRRGDELFSAASFFESQSLPLGRRIAIRSAQRTGRLT